MSSAPTPAHSFIVYPSRKKTATVDPARAPATPSVSYFRGSPSCNYLHKAAVFDISFGRGCLALFDEQHQSYEKLIGNFFSDTRSRCKLITTQGGFPVLGVGAAAATAA